MSLKSFQYSGIIESSKSIVNRALILKAIHPHLKLNYTSQAKDILLLETAIQDFKKQTSTRFDVGSGGTTFRFLSLFLSKYLGTWNLKLSSQLVSRPYQDLVDVLTQLGVTVLDQNIKLDHVFTLKSSFWTSNEVTVDFAKSSQFFSGLALAASDKTQFTIHCKNRNLTSGYENITLDLLKKMGVTVLDQDSKVVIQNQGSASATEISVGADWSSVIYLLSFCFSGSSIEIKNIDLNSLEPDRKGLEFLLQLGLKLSFQGEGQLTTITAEPSNLETQIQSLNFKTNPDLFPILMVLISQYVVKSKSDFEIHYPEQLAFKESDRLGAMIEVLTQLGFEVLKPKHEVLILRATDKVEDLKLKSYLFDSKKDHRLIMSYELLKSFGYKIDYNDKDEVQKSFSNFFEIIYG